LGKNHLQIIGPSYEIFKFLELSDDGDKSFKIISNFYKDALSEMTGCTFYQTHDVDLLKGELGAIDDVNEYIIPGNI
jgi:hypothetical protein